MSRMLVVLDTNVVISMLMWRGSLERLFELVNERRVRLAFSPATIDELICVVRYPKICEAAEEFAVPLESLVDTLIAASVIVYPGERVTAVREDPSDNRILEAALAADAVCVISGDKHLLRLGQHRGIQILSPVAFLRRFADD